MPDTTESQTIFENTERAVHADYAKRTPKSMAWHERASRSLVAGVSGTVRYFAPYPLYFASGEGPHAFDIDDNRYIDCFLCGACHLLGHRNVEVTQALESRSDAGSMVLNPMMATEVAEKLQEMVPSAERVRLLNSGTEAVMSAMRFARAFTGRSKIVKCNGIYHGMADQMLVGMDGRGIRLGAGIPEEVVSQTALMRFGDLDELAGLLDAGDVAGVLVDPSMHHGGLWAGDSDYYKAVKKLVEEAGALLIFDEVISGFRLAPGGGQEYYGVTPDLSVFGKAFCVGEKLGAVVGRADVMSVADPSGRSKGPFAFQSGTCSDSTAGQAAALAAMTAYQRLGREGAYERLAKLAVVLAEGLREAFTDHGVPCGYKQLGPMVRLFLTDGPFDYEHTSRLDMKPLNLFHLALINEGVLTIPGSRDFFLSFAHTEKEIREIIEAARRVLDRYDFASLTR